jgi:hypothetical protein
VSNVRIKLNPAGVRAILRSPKVLADLERRAQNVATAAGPGHHVEARLFRNRARAEVVTETDEAKVAEATERTLTRAFDAARR